MLFTVPGFEQSNSTLTTFDTKPKTRLHRQGWGEMHTRSPGRVGFWIAQAVARMCTPRVTPGQRVALDYEAHFRGPHLAAVVDTLRVHLPPLLLLPDDPMEETTPRDCLLKPQVGVTCCSYAFSSWQVLICCPCLLSLNP